MTANTQNGNGELTPEQWVDLSRKFVRQARGEFARKDLSVINSFIRFVGAKPKILGINRHRSKQDHPTPWNLISAIENRFDSIEIDLAATKSNTKAGRYITPRQDSLKQDWTAMLAGKLGYLNPPFDPVTPWTDKCIEESVKGARFVMLTQASIDSKWFWKIFPYCTVYALRSRVTFIGSSHSFPKPLILSAFNVVRIGAEPGPSGRLHEWDWMKDVGDGRLQGGR
ncbi:MAG TPA: DNA N-6-adenine-methyltransferase [Pyrinomonadaceae bacterium]|nr:DNA N-6-adenine-methyltransferase [Pyrinomonadaceae bacterium]